MDDAMSEPTEEFEFHVTVATGSTANSAATSMVTLEDNDAPTVSVSNVLVTEGVDGFAEFSIDLSNASFEDIDLDLVLTDGLADGGGVDYGTNGAGNLEVSQDDGLTWVDATSVTIVSGTTTALARTPVVDDGVAEGSEDFTLTVTVSAGATQNASAAGDARIVDAASPIVDDDGDQDDEKNELIDRIFSDWP